MIKGLPFLALLFLLISFVFVNCCLTAPDNTESESAVQMQLTDTEKTAIASNRFALDMYRELESKRQDPGKKDTGEIDPNPCLCIC